MADTTIQQTSISTDNTNTDDLEVYGHITIPEFIGSDSQHSEGEIWIQL